MRLFSWVGKVESSLEADSYPNRRRRVCCRCRNGWCCWFFECTYNPHLINNVSSVTNASSFSSNDVIRPPVGRCLCDEKPKIKFKSSLSYTFSWPNSSMPNTNTRRRVEVFIKTISHQNEARRLSVCALDGWWEKRIRFDFSVQISCLFRIYLDFLHLQQTIISRN